MIDYIKKTAMSYDGEEIDVSDIPEITDFSGWRKNPHVGNFIKDGKFIAVIEHGGYNEVAEFDIQTNQKTVLQLVVNDERIEVEKSYVL